MGAPTPFLRELVHSTSVLELIKRTRTGWMEGGREGEREDEDEAKSELKFSGWFLISSRLETKKGERRPVGYEEVSRQKKVPFQS